MARKCFLAEGTSNHKNFKTSFFRLRSFSRATLIACRSAKPSRTLHQDFASCKDCSLGDLDALEKSFVVSFLHGGFVFQLATAESRSLEPKMNPHGNAIGYLLTREPDGCNRGNPKKEKVTASARWRTLECVTRARIGVDAGGTHPRDR